MTSNDSDIYSGGVFRINKRPMVFYVCNSSAGINFGIETGGGVICDSSTSAQIIIFNRDVCPNNISPRTPEEKHIVNELEITGIENQYIVSSLWIYDCLRDKKLLRRDKYIIKLNLRELDLPYTSTPCSTSTPTPTPTPILLSVSGTPSSDHSSSSNSQNFFTPLPASNNAVTQKSTNTTKALLKIIIKRPIIPLTPSSSSPVQSTCLKPISKSRTPISATIFRKERSTSSSSSSSYAKEQPIISNSGRQTNNSLISSLSGLESSNDSRIKTSHIPSSLHTGDGSIPGKEKEKNKKYVPIITNGIDQEEAATILANELYEFAHSKDGKVISSDIRGFIRHLGSKRHERNWDRFYARHHEVVDKKVKDLGGDPTGWYIPPNDKPIKDHSSKIVDGDNAFKNKGAMKGWTYVLADQGPQPLYR
ncbi:uncharacterized protein L201_006974 [Kwoniella dendrophila CBS 6074]|uniref:BRCT domain-containing protein n=1 Tax=Kwoniella dendrophila CBS 6074 TaxID=1295534 RepID=A0AAX4K325_9TREE